ncbi:MAG: glycogen debranching protein GlgX [Alphaproteobacteria bacterium]|nr:glycogen debranching protein GlgX [Alphaproteobacteria bacterium]
MNPQHLSIASGRPFPLGSDWDGGGVNFALFSAHATRVELCLFDALGDHEVARFDLPDYTDEVWHGYVAGLAPGQRYGFRVHGPYAPAEGHRFNPAKLLIDPYARLLDRPFAWHDALRGEAEDGGPDSRDSAPFLPKCVVAGLMARTSRLDPPHAWRDTLLYELHLRGYTRRHGGVPERLRGTFAGLADPAVVDHLADLGVTAVELLPVQAFGHERHLAAPGLVNYWGYNSIAWLAPEPRYMADGPHEIVEAVARLHDAGIEVILDVVYNHSGDGDVRGPTISLRGIDNKSYYRLGPGGEYLNESACGNTLDLTHPRALQLVLDSLRHWVETYGVDGFRFDLAPALARTGPDYDPRAPFLSAVAQDPVLSRVKLIAEAWDIGPDGYQVGRFPPGWSEWNDQYLQTVRRFWRGDHGQRAALASRVTGSSDLFDHGGRRPTASVNYVACHDGFTLADVVSYAHKHNEANGEGNRDGTDRNFSANWGVEGPTGDPAVLALRARTRRNMMATLLLSSGVPMLAAGDEFGRSQGGNNNAYCQDNETSWLDWDGADRDFAAFVGALAALRRRHPSLRRDRFFRGAGHGSHGEKDVLWFDADGRELTDAAWHDADAVSLGMRLTDEPGRSLAILFNAGADPLHFALPPATAGRPWRLVLDTATVKLRATATPPDENTYDLEGRSLAVFEDAP